MSAAPAYFHDLEPLTAHRLNELVDRIVRLESRLAVERSKWCHHCGAPWDWARPTFRYCGTCRPPEGE